MTRPAVDDSHGEHTVGIRDLSHRTSQVLDRVRAGERIVVTDHGKPFAVVIPLRGASMVMPAVGYAPSGDPDWAARAAEELTGFAE